MEQDKKKVQDAGFRLHYVLLLESNFSRVGEVKFDPSIENLLDIKTEVSVSGNMVNVAEKVSVSQKCKGVEQVKVEVTMAGVFEHTGNSPLAADLEKFGRINGAAIIYPYIREHIGTLSLKAGISPIVLPIVNFDGSQKIEK